MADYMGFKERFGVAVEVLATSPAPLRERVEQGIVSIVPMFAEAETAGLSVGLQQKMRDLQATITREEDPTGKRGKIAATLDTMTDSDLSGIAGDIFELYWRFAELHGRSTK